MSSPFSEGERRWESVVGILREMDLVVLGGDIFDVEWTRLAERERAKRLVRDWLARGVESNPRATWVYLLGNHDCNLEMQQVLSEFMAECPCFQWHAHWWQCGEHLFLHGDLLDSGGFEGHADYRAKYLQPRPTTVWAQRGFGLVVRTRFHWIVPWMIHRPQKTCERLASYLATQSGSMFPYRHVYFGHTHVPIRGRLVGGVRYSNAGSGIRHLPFRPVRFEY